MVVVSVVIKSGTRHFLGNYWPVTGLSEYRRKILAYPGQRTFPTFRLDVYMFARIAFRVVDWKQFKSMWSMNVIC